MRAILVSLLLAGAALTVLPGAAASDLPVGCNADVGACVWTETPNGDCAGVHLGLQGAGACADDDPASVRVCSSARSVFWEGNCPTDGLVIATSAANPVPPVPDVTCNPDFAGVCATTGPGAACVGVNFGLQGASACAWTKPVDVRVCTSLYTAFWGACPTSVLAPFVVSS